MQSASRVRDQEPASSGGHPPPLHRSEDRSHQALPGEIFTDHFLTCFINDPVGLELLDEVGRDSIMFETDYPHQDGTFAETSQVARGDALRWFGLDLPA